jgi:hypothetical protein
MTTPFSASVGSSGTPTETFWQTGGGLWSAHFDMQSGDRIEVICEGFE